MKRIISVLVCVFTVISLVGCRKNPEGSLVVNKDLDKMIEEATTPDSDKVGVDELVDKYDTYKTTVNDEKLGVKVNVDAVVDIPKTDRLSVFRVEQMDFTDELISKIRKELMGDMSFYDGVALGNGITKKSVEAQIAYVRENREAYTEADYNEIMADLEEMYEKAPEKLDVTDHLSNGKLQKVKDLYDADPESYSWHYSVNPDGEMLSAVSDGKDGTYRSLYVQNCYEFGNKLVYSRNSYAYGTGRAGGVITDGISFETESSTNSTVPDNFISNGWTAENEDFVLAPFPDETAELSRDDAEKIAEEFLANVGIEGFEFYRGGLYSELIVTPVMVEGADGMYRTYYILEYCRNIEGAFLTQSSGTKRDMGDPQSGNYSKKTWGAERIIFRINDDGIVGFDWLAPLTVTETVVENSELKSFESICETFEKMMAVSKAQENTTRVYNIDRVRLSYSRISEADSFDTGLIVPVWDFSGYYEVMMDGSVVLSGNGSHLCINAIDGSIIDPDLGY